MCGSKPELANSGNTRWKERRVGSWHLWLSRETESATSRNDSVNSARARLRRNDSSFDMSFKTPSTETASFRRRMMLVSERDCHRWRSLYITPAISKAKTPTFLGLFRRSFFGLDGRTKMKL